MNDRDYKQIIEELLFVYGEPLKIDDISKVLELDIKTTKSFLDEMVGEFEFQKRGLVLREFSNYYQLQTRKNHSEYIAKLFEKTRTKNLTNSTLETLAIIAYKQPITRQEIEEIRGVKCNSSIDTLLSKDFICEAGRLDKIGKPILYKTTLNFLNQFGLKNLKELPKIEKFILEDEFLNIEEEIQETLDIVDSLETTEIENGAINEN